VFPNSLGESDNHRVLTCDTVRLVPIRKWPR
jgi:hypothetical protein